MNHFNKNKGSAIIIAILVSLIASALTLFTIGISREIIVSSELLLDKLQTQLSSENTIEQLKFYISTGQFACNYIKLSNGKKIYIDGRKQTFNKAFIFLKGAGGKIDIWYPDFEKVYSLLLKKGVSLSNALTIKNSLQDWYDKDNIPNQFGAEELFYKDQIHAKYSPRNFSGVQSTDEWTDIRGFLNNNNFKNIKPYLILCPIWKPNINAMDPTMLSLFLNTTKNESKQLIQLKKQKGCLTITDIYRVIGKYPSSLNIFFPSFTLDIKVISLFNKAESKKECVIEFTPDKEKPFTVLKWKG